jgi:hypothetical protein
MIKRLLEIALDRPKRLTYGRDGMRRFDRNRVMVWFGETWGMGD